MSKEEESDDEIVVKDKENGVPYSNSKQDPLRVYQAKVINILKHMDEQGDFSTIVELPTGSGKTYTAVKYLVENALNNDCKILWLGHRSFLLEQACMEVKKTFIKENCPDKQSFNYVVIAGGKSSMDDICDDTDIIFSSIFSIRLEDNNNNPDEKSQLLKWLEKSQENNKKLYIVIDETHHVGACTYDKLLSGLLNQNGVAKNYALIGLSATPYRGDIGELKLFKWFKDGYKEEYKLRGKDRVLVDDKPDTIAYLKPDSKRFTKLNTLIGEESEVTDSGKRLIHKDRNDNIIKIVELQDLIKENILLEPDFIRVEDFISGGVSDVTVAQSVANNVLCTLNLGKTIIFAKNTDMAKEIDRILGDKSILLISKVKTNKDKNQGKKAVSRDDLLKLFNEKDDRKEKIDILVTIDILSEGFDLPELNTIILIGGTNSNIRLRQRIGRVVRKSKNSASGARVIWYYSAKDDKVEQKVGRYTTSNNGYDLTAIQNDNSLEVDKNRKTYYLTAPEYILPLDYQSSYGLEYQAKIGELLNILSLFKNNKDLKDFIGYYSFVLSNGFERQIYLDDILLKGFQQLCHRVRCDWLILKDSRISVSTFEEYLKAMGKSESEYIEDVMKICFFLCKPSRNSQFYVDREDIKDFVEYLISNNCIEPEVIYIQAKLIGFINQILDNEKSSEYSISNGIDKIHSMFLKRGDLSQFIKDFEENSEERFGALSLLKKCIQEYINKKSQEAESDNQDLLKKYRAKESACMEAGEKLSEEDKDVLKVSILLEKLIDKKKKERIDSYDKVTKKKEYTKELRVDNYINYEIEDIGNAIKRGYNWTKTPVKAELDKVKKEVPIVDMVFDIQNKRMSIDHKIRNNITAIKECDFKAFVLAQSILINTHHIVATEEDIQNFTKTLDETMKYFNVSVAAQDLDGLTKDVICKLGNFSKGKEYLAELIKAFQAANQAVPRFITYLVYDKVYEEIWSDIRFIRADKVLSGYCQNEGAITAKSNSILLSLGLKKDFFSAYSLNPVGDAISDYRPYIKTLRFYQGIKPDLLCRMINIVANQVPNCDHYITGCGGSGADLFNRFSFTDKIETETYNEHGYALTSFYNVLKDEKQYKELKAMVEKFINYIIKYNPKDTSEKNGGFTDFLFNAFKPEYPELFSGSSSELGKKARSEKANDSSNIIKLLYDNEYPFIYKYYITNNNADATKAEKNIIEDITLRENALHGIWHRCQKVFLWCQDKNSDSNIDAKFDSKIELAFVVFLYWSFADRYLFDNCFIQHFIEFASSYEQYIEMGHERVKDWDIYQTEKRDVVKVLKSPKYNKESSLTYCDIPYAETDASSYVSNLFEFDKFVKTLDSFQGKYIVSSRYNFCTTSEIKKAYYATEELSEEEYEAASKHQKKKLTENDIKANILTGHKFIDRANNIFKFYKSFLDMESEKGKAKYIVTPYTCKEELLEPTGKNTLYSNNYRLVLEDVEKMFKRTIFSNIPVEVMITNIDFTKDTEEHRLMEAYRLDDEISVIPTVRPDALSSSYYAEPIYLIIKYERYFQMLDRVLRYEELAKADRENAVNIFRDYLKKINN